MTTLMIGGIELNTPEKDMVTLQFCIEQGTIHQSAGRRDHTITRNHFGLINSAHCINLHYKLFWLPTFLHPQN